MCRWKCIFFVLILVLWCDPSFGYGLTPHHHPQSHDGEGIENHLLCPDVSGTCPKCHQEYDDTLQEAICRYKYVIRTLVLSPPHNLPAGAKSCGKLRMTSAFYEAEEFHFHRFLSYAIPTRCPCEVITKTSQQFFIISPPSSWQMINGTRHVIRLDETADIVTNSFKNERAIIQAIRNCVSPTSTTSTTTQAPPPTVPPTHPPQPNVHPVERDVYGSYNHAGYDNHPGGTSYQPQPYYGGGTSEYGRGGHGYMTSRHDYAQPPYGYGNSYAPSHRHTPTDYRMYSSYTPPLYNNYQPRYTTVYSLYKRHAYVTSGYRLPILTNTSQPNSSNNNTQGNNGAYSGAGYNTPYVGSKGSNYTPSYGDYVPKYDTSEMPSYGGYDNNRMKPYGDKKTSKKGGGVKGSVKGTKNKNQTEYSPNYMRLTKYHFHPANEKLSPSYSDYTNKPVYMPPMNYYHQASNSSYNRTYSQPANYSGQHDAYPNYVLPELHASPPYLPSIAYTNPQPNVYCPPGQCPSCREFLDYNQKDLLCNYDYVLAVDFQHPGHNYGPAGGCNQAHIFEVLKGDSYDFAASLSYSSEQCGCDYLPHLVGPAYILVNKSSLVRESAYSGLVMGNIVQVLQYSYHNTLILDEVLPSCYGKEHETYSYGVSTYQTECPMEDYTCPQCYTDIPYQFEDIYCTTEYAVVFSYGFSYNGSTPYRRSVRAPYMSVQNYGNPINGGEYNIQVASTVPNGSYYTQEYKQQKSCHTYQIRTMYNVNPYTPSQPFMKDYTCYIPSHCSCPTIQTGGGYAFMMSKQPNYFHSGNAMQMTRDYVIVPLHQGKVSLPTCKPTPEKYVSYTPSASPYEVKPVYEYKENPSYGQECPFYGAITCPVCLPKITFNIHDLYCYAGFAAIVYIKPTAYNNETSSYNQSYIVPRLSMYEKPYENTKEVNIYTSVYPRQEGYGGHDANRYQRNTQNEKPQCIRGSLYIKKDVSPKHDGYNEYNVPMYGSIDYIILKNCQCDFLDYPVGYALLLSHSRPQQYGDEKFLLDEKVHLIALPYGETVLPFCSNPQHYKPVNYDQQQYGTGYAGAYTQQYNAEYKPQYGNYNQTEYKQTEYEPRYQQYNSGYKQLPQYNPQHGSSNPMDYKQQDYKLQHGAEYQQYKAEYKPQPKYNPQHGSYNPMEYKQQYEQAEYKHPEYKPEYKQPDYKPPEYKQPAYKPPEYKHPEYKSEYKQPEYKPEYKQPEYKPPEYNQQYGISSHHTSHKGTKTKSHSQKSKRDIHDQKDDKTTQQQEETDDETSEIYTTTYAPNISPSHKQAPYGSEKGPHSQGPQHQPYNSEGYDKKGPSPYVEGYNKPQDSTNYTSSQGEHKGSQYGSNYSPYYNYTSQHGETPTHMEYNKPQYEPTYSPPHYNPGYLPPQQNTYVPGYTQQSNYSHSYVEQNQQYPKPQYHPQQYVQQEYPKPQYDPQQYQQQEYPKPQYHPQQYTQQEYRNPQYSSNYTSQYNKSNHQQYTPQPSYTYKPQGYSAPQYPSSYSQQYTNGYEQQQYKPQMHPALQHEYKQTQYASPHVPHYNRPTPYSSNYTAQYGGEYQHKEYNQGYGSNYPKPQGYSQPKYGYGSNYNSSYSQYVQKEYKQPEYKPPQYAANYTSQYGGNYHQMEYKKPEYGSQGYHQQYNPPRYQPQIQQYNAGYMPPQYGSTNYTVYQQKEYQPHYSQPYPNNMYPPHYGTGYKQEYNATYSKPQGYKSHQYVQTEYKPQYGYSPPHYSSNYNPGYVQEQYKTTYGSNYSQPYGNPSPQYPSNYSQQFNPGYGMQRYATNYSQPHASYKPQAYSQTHYIPQYKPSHEGHYHPSYSPPVYAPHHVQAQYQPNYSQPQASYLPQGHPYNPPQYKPQYHPQHYMHQQEYSQPHYSSQTLQYGAGHDRPHYHSNYSQILPHGNHMPPEYGQQKYEDPKPYNPPSYGPHSHYGAQHSSYKEPLQQMHQQQYDTSDYDMEPAEPYGPRYGRQTDFNEAPLPHDGNNFIPGYHPNGMPPMLLPGGTEPMPYASCVPSYSCPKTDTMALCEHEYVLILDIDTMSPAGGGSYNSPQNHMCGSARLVSVLRGHAQELANIIHFSKKTNCQNDIIQPYTRLILLIPYGAMSTRSGRTELILSEFVSTLPFSQEIEGALFEEMQTCDVCLTENDHCPDCYDKIPDSYEEKYCTSTQAVIVSTGLDLGAMQNSFFDIAFKMPRHRVAAVSYSELEATIEISDPTVSHSNSSKGKCTQEKMKIMYDVSRFKQPSILTRNIQSYVPMHCKCSLSSGYGLIISKYGELEDQVQLTEGHLIFPLPLGTFILPSCRPHVAPISSREQPLPEAYRYIAINTTQECPDNGAPVSCPICHQEFDPEVEETLCAAKQAYLVSAPRQLDSAHSPLSEYGSHISVLESSVGYKKIIVQNGVPSVLLNTRHTRASSGGQCQPGFVWSECAPPPGCEPSCDILSGMRCYSTDRDCHPGCVCPENLLRKSSVCVPPEECQKGAKCLHGKLHLDRDLKLGAVLNNELQYLMPSHCSCRFLDHSSGSGLLFSTKPILGASPLDAEVHYMALPYGTTQLPHCTSPVPVDPSKEPQLQPTLRCRHPTPFQCPRCIITDPFNNDICRSSNVILVEILTISPGADNAVCGEAKVLTSYIGGTLPPSFQFTAKDTCCNSLTVGNRVVLSTSADSWKDNSLIMSEKVTILEDNQILKDAIQRCNNGDNMRKDYKRHTNTSTSNNDQHGRDKAQLSKNSTDVTDSKIDGSCNDNNRKCPVCHGMPPQDFQKIYCTSKEVLIFAIGIDYNLSTISGSWWKGELYFRKPKMPTLSVTSTDLSTYKIQVSSEGFSTKNKNEHNITSCQKKYKEHARALYNITHGQEPKSLELDLDLTIPSQCNCTSLSSESGFIAVISKSGNLQSDKSVNLDDDTTVIQLPIGSRNLPLCKGDSYNRKNPKPVEPSNEHDLSKDRITCPSTMHPSCPMCYPTFTAEMTKAYCSAKFAAIVSMKRNDTKDVTDVYGFPNVNVLKVSQNETNQVQLQVQGKRSEMQNYHNAPLFALKNPCDDEMIYTGSYCTQTTRFFKCDSGSFHTEKILKGDEKVTNLDFLVLDYCPCQFLDYPTGYALLLNSQTPSQEVFQLTKDSHLIPLLHGLTHLPQCLHHSQPLITETTTSTSVECPKSADSCPKCVSKMKLDIQEALCEKTIYVLEVTITAIPGKEGCGKAAVNKVLLGETKMFAQTITFSMNRTCELCFLKGDVLYMLTKRDDWKWNKSVTNQVTLKDTSFIFYGPTALEKFYRALAGCE